MRRRHGSRSVSPGSTTSSRGFARVEAGVAHELRGYASAVLATTSTRASSKTSAKPSRICSSCKETAATTICWSQHDIYGMPRACLQSPATTAAIHGSRLPRSSSIRDFRVVAARLPGTATACSRSAGRRRCRRCHPISTGGMRIASMHAAPARCSPCSTKCCAVSQRATGSAELRGAPMISEAPAAARLRLDSGGSSSPA